MPSEFVFEPRSPRCGPYIAQFLGLFGAFLGRFSTPPPYFEVGKHKKMGFGLKTRMGQWEGCRQGFWAKNRV